MCWLSHVLLNMSTISFNCALVNSGGPLIQSLIKRSKLCSLINDNNGVQRRFITEKPLSKFDVDGGINKLNLKSLAMLG